MTGDQLKRYLDTARGTIRAAGSRSDNRDIPFYNFDMVDGVSYALDLGQPAGGRVLNLSYRGKPVTPEQTFTMAISTYRLRGGGGYMAAIGFTGAPELITKASQRNLLLRIRAGPRLSESHADEHLAHHPLPGP